MECVECHTPKAEYQCTKCGACHCENCASERMCYTCIPRTVERIEIKKVAKEEEVRTIVKWAGGKTQSLDIIKKHIPEFKTYYEPFLGGGALLFSLTPKKAIVGDINDELMNFYQVLAKSVKNISNSLELKENTKEYYYAERSVRYKNNIQRAARFYYLNKTCFNGLYRVNKSGKFNVPYGKYKTINYLNFDRLKEVHGYLKNIKLISAHYRKITLNIKKGDFVYFDPPYYKVEDTSFTSYTKDGFGPADHGFLCNYCKQLNEKGVKFLLSNSDTKYIRKIYSQFKIIPIKARRSINSDGNKRGKVNDLLIKNY